MLWKHKTFQKEVYDNVKGQESNKSKKETEDAAGHCKFVPFSLTICTFDFICCCCCCFVTI